MNEFYNHYLDGYRAISEIFEKIARDVAPVIPPGPAGINLSLPGSNSRVFGKSTMPGYNGDPKNQTQFMMLFDDDQNAPGNWGNDAYLDEIISLQNNAKKRDAEIEDSWLPSWALDNQYKNELKRRFDRTKDSAVDRLASARQNTPGSLYTEEAVRQYFQNHPGSVARFVPVSAGLNYDEAKVQLNTAVNEALHSLVDARRTSRPANQPLPNTSRPTFFQTAMNPALVNPNPWDYKKNPVRAAIFETFSRPMPGLYYY